MGNHSGKKQNFSEWDLQRLSQMTGLSPQQLTALHQQFEAKAGKDGLLDRQEFVKLMSEQGYDTRNLADVERSFRAFDRDGSNKLAFEEYAMALVLSNNNVNPQERFQYVIMVNNPNQGFITPQYASEVFYTMNLFWGAQMDPNEAWGAINDGSDQLSEGNFFQYVYQMPTYGVYFN